MASNGVRIQGLNDLQRFLLNLVPNTKREILQITEASVRNMQADAVRRAPVDTGKLRQGITFEMVKGGFGAVLASTVPYGMYIEFGTGGLVDVPEGFEDLAAAYRGNGKRQVNIPAQPYLIPAFLVHSELYYKAIDAALGRIFK